MRCRDVDNLSSAYLDGELDDGRASALRGHLRGCTRCLELIEDIANIRDTAARLEPIDPPPSLWAAVERGLAEAEIADSERSWLWLRWQAAWQAIRPRLLPGAVVVAAAAVLVLWLTREARETETADNTHKAQTTQQTQQTQQTTITPVQVHEFASDSADGPPEPAFAVQREAEILDADRRYIKTIAELLDIVGDERERWPSDIRSAFDARIAEFRDAARARRQALAINHTPDPTSRDALYAIYQAEIEFLQTAAVDGMPPIALNAGGGR